MDTKVCSLCGVEKKVDEFYSSGVKRGRQYYHSSCKECARLKHRERWSSMTVEEKRTWNKHQNSKKEYHKNYRLVTKYGITLEQFNEMYNHQQGSCAICGKHTEENKMCVDHNHTTNAVRRLLCHNCNVILGHCFEDVTILMKCVEYINAHV